LGQWRNWQGGGETESLGSGIVSVVVGWVAQQTELPLVDALATKMEHRSLGIGVEWSL